MELHATAHPNDRLVGWYRTGLRIDGPSISIHQTVLVANLIDQSNKISKKAGPELLLSEYIHLLIDTDLKNNKLSMKAFTIIPINDPLQEMEYQNYLKEKKRRERAAKQKKSQSNKPARNRKRKRNRGKDKENKDDPQKTDKNDKSEDKDTSSKSTTTTATTASQSQKESPSKPSEKHQTQQKEKEKAKEDVEEPLEEKEKPYPIFHRFKEITTEYLASESEKIGLDMIIESPPQGNALDSPSMLMNDTNHLENVLQILLQNLEQVENYVHAVINGASGDENIGWMIGDALSSIPNLSPSKFESMISAKLQDFLMMVYLGKMTKAQLQMADKINKILPSTVPGYGEDDQ